MTNAYKFLVTAIAAFSFAAVAQSTTSGSAPTSDSTTTSGSSTTDSVGSMPTNPTMNNVPPTNTDGTRTSKTTSTTSSTTATSRDPAMIRQAQQALLDKGISTAGPVDGFWGTRSTAALREFQRQENLPVTGQLDSQTLSALGISSSNGFSPGTTGDDTAPGMQQRQGRNPSDVIDDTAPMDNTTPGTGRSPTDNQQR